MVSGRPSTASESGRGRPALIIALLLTSFAAALAVVSLSATQLSERGTAQTIIARSLRSLLEIDQFVLNAWPALESAAADGDWIPLTDYPIPLEVDPAGLVEGPAVVSHTVAIATASMIYDEGLEALSGAPQEFGFVSQSALFEATVGRLSQGGHAIATAALIVSGTLTILLAMAAASQARGLARIGAPALAIALGATLVWIAATIAQSLFEGRDGSTLDPFAADLWLIASDAASILLRNAAIVAIASAVVFAAATAGGALLRLLDASEPAGRTGFRSSGPSQR